MNKNVEWLYRAKWGMMCHWLADAPGDQAPIAVEEWNKRVNAFNVGSFVSQIKETGAGYCLFTIGQCSGFFCSPNGTYDELVRRTPSRCSERDLIRDLGEELAANGVRLIAYLPSHAPSRDPKAVENLKCVPPWDARMWGLHVEEHTGKADERLSDFQRNWEAVIREWSDRWNKLVSGWWMDGCYYADRMYRHGDAPNFKSLADALKSGNPESIVAFNPGVRVPVVTLTEHEDYTAGEISDALPADDFWTPSLNRWVGNAQYHLLTFLGNNWGKGKPRFPDKLVAGYTEYINSFGGVITYDTPITQVGVIPGQFIKQLRKIRSQ